MNIYRRSAAPSANKAAQSRAVTSRRIASVSRGGRAAGATSAETEREGRCTLFISAAAVRSRENTTNLFWLVCPDALLIVTLFQVRPGCCKSRPLNIYKKQNEKRFFCLFSISSSSAGQSTHPLQGGEGTPDPGNAAQLKQISLRAAPPRAETEASRPASL